ncbi:MAG: hypothetical protein JXM69_03540 [Anaerolineae bacterium]|nr:hypothetical protein [Anaerolineae bacterium]
MADFIGNAGSTQLLILMMVPLLGAVLLVGFIVIFFRRNRKKAGMKHGIQTKDESPAQPEPDEQLQPSPPTPVDQEVSPEPPATEGTIEPSSAPAQALDLNLDILSRVEMSTLSGAGTPADEEKIDLAGRLGTSAQPPAAQPAVTPSPPTATQPVTPPQSPPQAELMRLLRDPQSGRLIVEVAGQHYTRLTDIDDRETGQYVLELAAHLLAFTNGVIATDVGVKSVYLPRVGETPLPIKMPAPASQPPAPSGPPPSSSPESPPASTESRFVPRPSPEAEAAFLASLQAQRPQQPSPAEPQVRRGGLFGRPSRSEAESLPAFNLAQEINKIVQTRLSISPLPSIGKIEIQSDPRGGIQIYVDGVIYPNPDDIPDPEVKTLIKESIKQWERS